MFRKYIGDSSPASDMNKDEIGKINLRIDHWSNLLGKTNEDIKILKDMVYKLEHMITGKGGGEIEMAAAAEGGALEQLSDREREISALQEVINKLEEEKHLQSRYIDELDDKLNGKNEENNALHDKVAGLEAELAQQSRHSGDLATKLNNKKISAMSALIENLGMEKKRQSQLLEELALKIEHKDKTIDELKEKIGALEAEISKEEVELQAHDAETIAKLTEKEKEIGALHERISALNAESDKQKELLAGLESAVIQRDRDAKARGDKIRDLETQNERKKQQVVDLLREVDEKDQEIQALNTLIARLEEEKGRQTQQVERLHNAVLSLQQQSGKLEHWNEVYHPLMEMVYACMALKAFVEENKLGNAVSLETTLQFIRCIGNDYGFALRIHQAFATYKREIQEPITQREVAVYEAINTYYKTVKGISYDIFMLPNGLSIDDPFCEGMEFDKAEVKDMMSGTNDDFKTIRCVFVPVLKEKNGIVVAKGIVKGDANELF